MFWQVKLNRVHRADSLNLGQSENSENVSYSKWEDRLGDSSWNEKMLYNKL